MPTVLFSPGLAGLAHVIRCLAVAESLNDCKCIIVVEPGHRKFILRNYKPPKHIKFIEHEAPFYNDMCFWCQATRHNFPESTLRSEVYYYLNLTKKIKPDFVIGDCNLFGVMAARVLGINCTLLSVMSLVPHQQQGIKVSKNRLVQKNFDKLYSKIVNRKIIDLLDKQMISAYRQEGLYGQGKSTREIIDEFDKILFDNPRTTSLSPSAPNVSYYKLPVANLEVGNPQLFDKLKTKTKGKRVAYITLGGTGYNPKLCQGLVESFLQADYFVICSTAQVLDPKDLPKSDNLYTDNFLPGYMAAALADVIISHGSQGTIAQAIETHTPLLAIPFNVDQYLSLLTQTSPFVRSVLPLKLRTMVLVSVDPVSLTKLPSKIRVEDIVAQANKINSKPQRLKRLPKHSQNQALVKHLMAGVSASK